MQRDDREEFKIDKNGFEIVRYDPRKDKEELESLIGDFEYRSVYPIDLEKFIKEIDNRVKDLKLRNAMILAKEEWADKIKRASFPGLLSNHHLHNVAGLAVVLAEMMEFGVDYSKQIMKNAKALAQSLHERGWHGNNSR